MAGAEVEEEKLRTFLQWLQVNKVELRSCEIKYSGRNKGFGLFSSVDVSDDGVLLVVPLDLAITPMRVLQDPLIGPDCRAMLEEGEVDDRFLMILFLLVERLRENSSWKPYLDMLPTTFGNPLWFSDCDLLELKGTALHRASELQKKSLMSLFEDKAKDLVRKLLILDGNTKTEASFEDFLWANSVFWTRALNIPFPRSFSEGQANGLPSTSSQDETVWVEGLVPGIDFCNHDLRAMATWEVDGTGSKTGTPCSMYLLSVICRSLVIGKLNEASSTLAKRSPSVMEAKAMKMTDLEEGTGTEESDSELLLGNAKEIGNHRSSIVYRKGQKEMTRLFLREAEHALHLSLTQGN
ncbi:Ribulose-1,5 bisphosphate carboxylase/oxygenase large subunit N-methyltransferase, chloroplastic [Linum perenne]